MFAAEMTDQETMPAAGLVLCLVAQHGTGDSTNCHSTDRDQGFQHLLSWPCFWFATVPAPVCSVS
jgi:hypothetical protein